jgi:hypothetical protein
MKPKQIENVLIVPFLSKYGPDVLPYLLFRKAFLPIVLKPVCLKQMAVNDVPNEISIELQT